MFSCETCKIFKNVVFYRTTPVTTSVIGEQINHPSWFTTIFWNAFLKNSCWWLPQKCKCLFVRLYITKKNNGKYLNNKTLKWSEALAQRCSVKKLFLETSQNSQKSTCSEACNFIKKETLTQVFSCECCEISKNIFSYRTSTVAASEWFIQRVLQDQRVLNNIAAVMFSLVSFETFWLVAGFIFNSCMRDFVSALNKL